VVDLVVPGDPDTGGAVIDELRQRTRQQLGEGLFIDLPCSQRVIQRAMAAAELRDQRQLHQRGHRVISAQNRIDELELRVRPRGQAARTASRSSFFPDGAFSQVRRDPSGSQPPPGSDGRLIPSFTRATTWPPAATIALIRS
jgi:hypothetical protein